MKKVIIIFFIICTYLFVNSQNIYFSKIYHFNGTEIISNVVPIDSGYFVVGTVEDTLTGYGRVGILYIDNIGNEVWLKSYGDNKDYSAGASGSFIPVNSGGFALAGSINHLNGDWDVILWRFKQNGDTLWTKIYKDTTTIKVTYNCVQTRDNGFALVGRSNVGVGAIFMKTDSSGNEEFTSLYNCDAIGPVDTCYDGGYILGSYIKPGSYYDAYVLKTDSVGTVQWDKIFGGPYDNGTAKVRSTKNGGYIIAADSSYAEHPSSYLDYDYIYLLKLDNSGNIEWRKTYKHGGIDVQVSMVRELSDGSFIVTGSVAHQNFGEIGFLLKTNEQGDSLWYRYYRTCYSFISPNDDYLRAVHPTDDGGYIMAGFRTGGWCGPQDMIVIKTNCLGFEAPPQPYFTDSIANIDSFKVVFINSSRYSDSVLISFGDGDTVTAFNSLRPTKYDTVTYVTHIYPETGIYIVTFTAFACGDTCIFTDTIFICPTLQTNFTFTQDSNTVIFTNQSQYTVNYIWYFGDGDTSIVKNPVHTYTDTGLYIVTLMETSCGDTGIFIDTIYVLPGSGINELQVSGFKLQISPNPFSDYTTIEVYVPKNMKNAEIVIYNVLGVIIKIYKIVQGYNAITVLKDELPSEGIYFYSLMINNITIEKRKMVIIK